MEDKAGKTAKEYKKRGMGYVEPWVITTLSGGGSTKEDSKQDKTIYLKFG